MQHFSLPHLNYYFSLHQRPHQIKRLGKEFVLPKGAEVILLAPSLPPNPANIEGLILPSLHTSRKSSARFQDQAPITPNINTLKIKKPGFKNP